MRGILRVTLGVVGTVCALNAFGATPVQGWGYSISDAQNDALYQADQTAISWGTCNGGIQSCGVGGYDNYGYQWYLCTALVADNPGSCNTHGLASPSNEFNKIGRATGLSNPNNEINKAGRAIGRVFGW